MCYVFYIMVVVDIFIILSHLPPSAGLLNYYKDFNFPEKPVALFDRLRNLLALQLAVCLLLPQSSSHAASVRIAFSFNFSTGNNGAVCFCTLLSQLGSQHCGPYFCVSGCGCVRRQKSSWQMFRRRIAFTNLLFTFLNNSFFYLFFLFLPNDFSSCMCRRDFFLFAFNFCLSFRCR